MGWAKQRHLPLMLSSQASCVIVSGFRAALDLDTYPLSNLIRPRYAELTKPGRGKPVLIMHIGFFACFSHHISRTQSFQQNRHIIFLALVALKLLVSLISRLVACSARIVVDRQTDRQTDTQNDYCNPRCACGPRVNNIHVARDTWTPSLENRGSGCFVASQLSPHIQDKCMYMY